MPNLTPEEKEAIINKVRENDYYIEYGGRKLAHIDKFMKEDYEELSGQTVKDLVLSFWGKLEKLTDKQTHEFLFEYIRMYCAIQRNMVLPWQIEDFNRMCEDPTNTKIRHHHLLEEEIKEYGLEDIYDKEITAYEERYNKFMKEAFSN